MQVTYITSEISLYLDPETPISGRERGPLPIFLNIEPELLLNQVKPFTLVVNHNNLMKIVYCQQH